MTRKATGELRLLIDFRKLNEITQRKKYPFPKLEKMMRNLYNKPIFSTIDLNQGYYQILMYKDFIVYTAFDLPFGRYEFLRMSFGLTNAPKSFQKAISSTLRRVVCARIYLDDILIANKDSSYKNKRRTEYRNRNKW